MTTILNKDLKDKLKSHKKKSRREVEAKIFDGKTRAEVMGLNPDDPATAAQKRKIFAVGGEMGWKIDDIKSIFEVESISNLTVKEAIDLINRMENPEGIPAKKKETYSECPEGKEWTRKAGVNMIGIKMARCYDCAFFTLETKTKGRCDAGQKSGSFTGDSIAPIAKDCFKSQYGELETKIEEKPDDDFEF